MGVRISSLGARFHNSSAWPIELPEVWESMAALHSYTIEAPVYWEQFEPQEGLFDFINVDGLIEGHAHTICTWYCYGSGHGKTLCQFRAYCATAVKEQKEPGSGHRAL